MEIGINYLLIVIALLFFVVAYFVGIKKQTWMLAGFNEARIRDKDRLARIAGYFFLNSGLFILLNSFISFQGQEHSFRRLFWHMEQGLLFMSIKISRVEKEGQSEISLPFFLGKIRTKHHIQVFVFDRMKKNDRFQNRKDVVFCAT